MKNLSVNSIQVKPRASVMERVTFSSVLVFLTVRIQSRDRDCAAQDSKKLISKADTLQGLRSGCPKRGKQPLPTLWESFYLCG